MANKKLWLVTLLLMPLYGDLSIGQMETMVEKIKAKRVGTVKKKESNFVSPFVMIQKDEGRKMIEKPKSADVSFVLNAMMNGRAFVNKKWLKVGDVLEGYTLTELNEKGATLTKDERVIKVFLKKSKQILELEEGKE